MNGARRESMARRSALVLFYRLATAGVGFLMVIVTARALGADGRGIFALISTAAMVIITALGGAATSLVAEYAHRRSSLGQIYAATITYAAASGAIALLVIGVVSIPLSQDVQLALGLSLLVAVPNLLIQVQRSLYEMQGAIRPAQYIQLGRNVLSLVALVAAAVVFPDQIWMIIGAWALVQPVMPILTTWALWRAEPPVWSGGRAIMRRVIRGGVPVSLANAAELINFRVDLIVVALLLPLDAVGLYSVAIAVAEAIWQISRAIYSATYSRVISAEPQEAARVTERTIRHAVLALAITSVLAIVVLAIAGGWIFGPEFSDVWLLLVLLTPGVIAFGAAEMLKPYLVVRLERTREFIMMTTIGMGANTVLAFAMVPFMGLAGAALSTSIAYGVGATFVLWRFTHLGGSRGPWSWIPGPQELADYRRASGAIRSRLG
jgi:O-antigen/teichoic acid export membrane protein